MIAIETPRPVASSCALSTSIARRSGLQVEIRIVVLRRLRVEQVHALREIDARIAIQGGDDVRDVAPLGNGQHLAIDVERLDRPAFDAAQVVLVRELRQDAIDGRRRAVAALQIALIRRARESRGQRRGLSHRHEHLPRGRVARCAAAVAHAVRARARREQRRGQRRRARFSWLHVRQRGPREADAWIGGQSAEQLGDLRRSHVAGNAHAVAAELARARRRSRRRCRRAALASRRPWCRSANTMSSSAASLAGGGRERRVVVAVERGQRREPQQDGEHGQRRRPPRRRMERPSRNGRANEAGSRASRRRARRRAGRSPPRPRRRRFVEHARRRVAAAVP